MKKVFKKTVGLLMAVMMIGSMLVCSVSAAEDFKNEFVKAIEEEFGVSAAAPVMITGAAAVFEGESMAVGR